MALRRGSTNMKKIEPSPGAPRDAIGARLLRCRTRNEYTAPPPREGAGTPLQRIGPPRFGRNGVMAFVSTAGVACLASGFGSRDRHHGFTLIHHFLDSVTRLYSFMRRSQCCLFAVSLERARNCECSSSGVGATLAVQGDDRLSDPHASQHCDIYHNGSSGFGGNADIAETADLTLCLI